MVEASKLSITNLHLHHVFLFRFDLIYRYDTIRCLVVLKYLLLIVFPGLPPVGVKLNLGALWTDRRIAHLMGNRERSGFHGRSGPLWVAIFGQGIVVSLSIYAKMPIIELNLNHPVLSNLVLIFFTSDDFTLECVHKFVEHGSSVVFVLRYGVWW